MVDLTFDLDLFYKEVNSDKTFKPMGEKVFEYTLEKDKQDAVYEIYKCDFSIKRFKRFHHRLQTFLIWYIEGARFLDDEDERWQFLLM
jgi:histone acetyltransferase 1